MNWEEFKRDDPELAALGEERFERTSLVLIGKLGITTTMNTRSIQVP